MSKRVIPHFKLNQRFEKFIFDGIKRDRIIDICDGQAGRRVNRWKMKDFDEYCLERSNYKNVLSEEMDIYLLNYQVDKAYKEFMEAEIKTSAAGEELKQLARRSASNEERYQAAAKYDAAKEELMTAAALRPYGPNNANMAFRVKDLTLSDYNAELKSGHIIWCDEKKKLGDSYGLLPSERLLPKAVSVSEMKKAADELKDFIRISLKNGAVPAEQAARFIAAAELVDNNQQRANGQNGHKEAEEMKEMIEGDDISMEPPKKRQRLNNDGNKRINMARKRSEQEA